MSDLKYSFVAMPASQASAEGMLTVAGDPTHVSARLEGDIVYANKNGRDLHVRLIYPNAVDNDVNPKIYPLMMHVQGSAWYEQNMNDHVMDFKEIVQAGFAVAIIQYRGSETIKIPGQICDAKDAARYLAAHAEELQLDINRFYLTGDSSGGHTAAMCWATWPVQGLLDEQDAPLPKVNAFIDFYGPTDMLSMTTQTSAMEHSSPDCPESNAMGCQAIDPACAERVKECCVLTYVREEVNNAPLMIMHGNKDRLVPFEQSVQFYEKAKEENKDVVFYRVQDADHGGPSFYIPAVYDLVVDFMNRH